MTDVDVSDHEPAGTDPQGHVRCVCGWRYPCPDVRNRPRALDADERELLEALELDVGMSCFMRRPDDGADVYPPGGIVVGVEDVPNGDGELERWVRTVDLGTGANAGRPVFHRFRVADVEPSTVGLANAAQVRARARLLARVVGERRGVATGEELEHLSDALTLLRSIA